MAGVYNSRQTRRTRIRVVKLIIPVANALNVPWDLNERQRWGRWRRMHKRLGLCGVVLGLRQPIRIVLDRRIKVACRIFREHGPYQISLLGAAIGNPCIRIRRIITCFNINVLDF